MSIKVNYESYKRLCAESTWFLLLTIYMCSIVISGTTQHGALSVRVQLFRFAQKLWDRALVSSSMPLIKVLRSSGRSRNDAAIPASPGNELSVEFSMPGQQSCGSLTL